MTEETGAAESRAPATQRRAWEVVEVAKGDDRSSRVFDIVILTLIVLSVVAIVLESVDSVRTRFGELFDAFETICVVVFSVEYLTRLWACTADPRYRQAVTGRLRFLITPLAMVDLLAILPYYMGAVGVDLRFVRMLRVFRLFRLAKLVRYTRALQLIGRVFRRSWHELVVTAFVIGVLAIVAACLMYFAEHSAQPEVFPDVPSTMWWAVITLTTVGYGDAFPITPLGKILAAAIALLGVGLLALPTAILGSAFVEELSERRATCPHCGKLLHDE